MNITYVCGFHVFFGQFFLGSLLVCVWMGTMAQRGVNAVLKYVLGLGFLPSLLCDVD